MHYFILPAVWMMTQRYLQINKQVYTCRTPNWKLCRLSTLCLKLWHQSFYIGSSKSQVQKTMSFHHLSVVSGGNSNKSQCWNPSLTQTSSCKYLTICSFPDKCHEPQLNNEILTFMYFNNFLKMPSLLFHSSNWWWFTHYALARINHSSS